MKNNRKKITKLTERQLVNLVKKVINEQNDSDYDFEEENKEDDIRLVINEVYDIASSLASQLESAIIDGDTSNIKFSFELVEELRSVVEYVKDKYNTKINENQFGRIAGAIAATGVIMTLILAQRAVDIYDSEGNSVEANVGDTYVGVVTEMISKPKVGFSVKMETDDGHTLDFMTYYNNFVTGDKIKVVIGREFNSGGMMVFPDVTHTEKVK